MLETVALAAILVAAPVVFVVLFFFTAPYGRHSREGWGPAFSARMGWLVMESPAVIVIALVVLIRGVNVSPLTLLLLGLWEMHYLYRTCVFPFTLRENGKGIPAVLVAAAMIFNTLNGYANGSFLAGAGNLPGGPFPVVRICAGVALFLLGFLTHVRADAGLRRLRKPGEIAYTVPRGGLFDLVASPNYFGEIVEWTGWALATWSLPGLAFALFTVGNLVPRAHSHRQWYLATFPDYPREGKRVIPFVY